MTQRKFVYRKSWIGLALVLIISFAILGYFGGRIYQEKPPIPENVVDSNGKVIFISQEIKDGQNVWQSIGGQEIGSVWGHGAYVAPDWTADWLHNTYRVDTGDLVISQIRADAIRNNSEYYASLFGNDPSLAELRDDYALPENTIKDPKRMKKLNAFFFWATWATATNRPDSEITYTANWPPEGLIDNKPSGELIV